MSEWGAVLSVSNLSVHFHTLDGLSRVLHGVDIAVSEREKVALVGETGCGKTVTAKVVLGSLPIPPGVIASGAVVFLGQRLLDLKPHERRRATSKRMSYVPQDPMNSLNPVFTVGQQMVDLIRWQGTKRVGPLGLLGLRRRGDNSRSTAAELLSRVSIPSPTETLKRYPVELSGGMRQRVLIATAMIGHPQLMIADEPTTALDVTIQKGILELLEDKVNEEHMSLVYITHNLGVARRLCDKTYVMYAGEVVEVGRTGELLDTPQHPYTAGLVASVPRLRGGEFHGIDGSVPDYAAPPSGCRFHPRCGSATAVCGEEKPELREVSKGHAVACHLTASRGQDEQSTR